jgi:hypothetical protein
MSKLLIEANIFQKLMNLFFKAKSNGNEDQFISKIQYDNPELADAFGELDKAIIRNSLNTKSILSKRGVDTTEIDNFLKKYYNKL